MKSPYLLTHYFYSNLTLLYCSNSWVHYTPLEIQIVFRGMYELFQEDPNSEILRNHSLNKLGKRYHGLCSIDVPEDYRAIYRKQEKRAVFIMLRTHQQLYGK